MDRLELAGAVTVAGAAAVAIVALAAVGVLATLLTSVFARAGVPALVVLGLVLASVAVVSAVGARSRGWLANPYW